MIQGKYLLIGSDISECLNIRSEVFVNEQGVSKDIEYDELDSQAIHGLVEDNGRYVATGRIIKYGDNIFKLGRVAVLKEERGKGFGDFVVRMLCDKAFILGAKEIVAGVQLHAVEFYEKIGFVKFGEEFYEANIKHIMMKLTQEDICKKCQR